METLELALGMVRQEHHLQLTWYLNQYDDFIKEVNINSVNGLLIDDDGGDEYGFNFDKIKIMGIELNWTWQLNKSLSLTSNLSRILDASEDPGHLSGQIISPEPLASEESELDFLADLTATLQLNYRLSNKSHIYWDAIYYSDRSVPSNYQTGSDIQAPDNSNSFVLSNLSAQHNYSEQLNVGISINNLFNEKVYSPTPDPASDYDAQWSMRQINLTFEWAFK